MASRASGGVKDDGSVGGEAGGGADGGAVEALIPYNIYTHPCLCRRSNQKIVSCLSDGLRTLVVGMRNQNIQSSSSGAVPCS
ncbi:hypothetical protein F2Q68_00019384 [Brassica cretica]|uniref:Uncharacterized protein n=1 Tax=Brassica cretica TaxID=69181 RepID=A0A8S9G350_BRACR|nr:hypothetical protein F2Q68_00019384 [Brassica cretica]